MPSSRNNGCCGCDRSFVKDPCCWCVTYDSIETTEGFGILGTAINIDLVLSAYTFCPTQNLDIEMTVNNVSGADQEATPVLILGDAFPSYGILLAANFGSQLLVSATPAGPTYSPGSAGVCNNTTSRVIWPLDTILAGTSKLYSVTLELQTLNPAFGSGGSLPAQIVGGFHRGGFLFGYKFARIVCNAAGRCRRTDGEIHS